MLRSALAPHDGPGLLYPRRKLGEEATQLLRDAILSGQFHAGDRMGVEELARRYHISTMPIREALVTLASEGLVTVLPRRGFRVAEISRQDVEDIFTLHAYVAGMLAGRAAGTIRPDDIEELRSIHAEMVAMSGRRVPRSRSFAVIEKLNYEFHRVVNRAAEGDQLRWVIRALTRHVPRRYFELPGWAETALAEHPSLIEALAARDAVRAEKLMSDHIKHGGKLVVETIPWSTGAAPTLASNADTGNGAHGRSRERGGRERVLASVKEDAGPTHGKRRRRP